MDIFDLSAKLSLDSKDYDRSLQNASTAAEKWATKFTMAAKAVGSAMSAVSKGIGTLASSAVKSFAQFQQLEGGIQTLFGAQGKSFEKWSETFSRSSDSMSDYADIARKVINGDFGSGSERRDLLSAAGYDPDTVQQMVNNLINGVDIASNISADTIATNMQSAEEKYEDLMEAQQFVMNRASGAFATAGISANEYMENVSAFAAALQQSTDSSYEAAQVADMAMVDMADNAAKLGTPLANVQAAYQGFAKQNYTLLDNLKLGYGGTKTEMERLLKDAQKVTGVKYDINNLTDVYKAIHVIQDELGIAGVAADEAETTMSGSAQMMKAAWSNLMTNMVRGGEALTESINDVVSSAKVVVKNWAPAIKGALEGVGALISGVVPEILAIAPGLAKDLLPGFVDATVSVINGIMDALPDLLKTLEEIAPIVVDALANFIPSVIDFIVDGVPQFISTGIVLLKALIDGLANNVGTIVPKLTQGLIDIADQIISIIQNDGANLASAGLTLLKGLADALVTAVPDVLTQITQLVQDLTASIGNAADGDGGSFLSTATSILTNLVNGLMESIPILVPQLTEAVAEFISQFASIVSSNTISLSNSAITILTSLVDGLAPAIPQVMTNITEAVMAIIQAIVDVITGYNPADIFKSAVAIVTAIADGLVASIGVITEKLPELITQIVAWLTNPENITGMYEAALTLFGELIADIPAILESLVTGLAGIITGIYTYFKDHGDEILQGFKDGFVNIGTKFSEIWEEKIKPAFEDLGTKMKDWLTQFDWGQTLVDFVEKITGAFSDLWEKIKTAFEGEGGLGAKIRGFFSQFDWGATFLTFVQKIKTGITEKFSNLKSAFTGEDGLVGKIKSWFAEFDLSSAISNLIQSIKDAIEGAWDSFKQWFQDKIGGLFSGIKVPNWIKKLFGKGEGNAEDTTQMDVEDETLVDMPSNMLTLDYSNLEPIPEDTLTSYQQLAEAILSINSAISGEEEGSGLNAALTSLPDLFAGVLTAAQSLAVYFSGGFVTAINTLLQHLCMASVDDEGNVDASGGNTLVTAMGVVFDLFGDILNTSTQLAEHWKGDFISASKLMRTEAGYADGTLTSLSGTAKDAAAEFFTLAENIYSVIDAYLALARVKNGGGKGGGNGKSEIELRAAGGPVNAGNSYIVGEHGPELFSPARSGYITPNERLAGNQTNITVNLGDVYGESWLSHYVEAKLSGIIRKEMRLAS